MRRQSAIRLTFVGLAVVIFDLIAGAAFTDLIYGSSFVWREATVHLIEGHWLRLAGAGVALLGAYFWVSSPKTS